MFQSLKKWVKNADVQQRPSPPPGMQLMKGDLQRKFAKGVQYNMKIVIRGDRNTGKTCLWHRLKGNGFMEEYIPTAEIQVASVQWDYKATDDIVKVDVWDVVDKGKKKESKGLKIAEESPSEILEHQVLDATFMDVYKHAHAVILIFDVTKKWTFKYIETELPKVPPYIPVLILANFRDMGHHRVIDIDEVEALVESIDRPPGSPSIMFYECSMKNGFGLRYIHKFFNMPFLLVQRESLLKQLETNHLDLESCIEELSTEEHSYEAFIQQRKDGKKGHTQKPPQQASNVAKSPAYERPPPPTTSTLSTPPVQEENNKKPESTGNNATTSSSAKESLFSPTQMESQTPTPLAPEPEKRGFMSRFFRRSSNDPVPVKEQSPQQIEVHVTKTETMTVANVDEFVPDEGSVDDFLNEVPDFKERRQAANKADSSDEDEENSGNPMVAGFQEDLDSDDDFGPSLKQATYSSSDSEPETIKSVKITPQRVARPNTAPIKEVASLPPSSLNIKKRTRPKVEERADSENDIPRPVIIQDADISSDENLNFSNAEFAIVSNKSPINESSDQVVNNAQEYRTESAQGQQKGAVTADSGSDIDRKENVTVSKTYDDISSNDELASHPPVAIVAPLQAERSISFENQENVQPKSEGLNLELSMADLNFLEHTTKQPIADDEKRQPKEEKRHRSKKSSRKRSEEDGQTRKSHKKHSTRGTEERGVSKTEESQPRKTKEDRERRKKRKSRDPGLVAKTDKIDDDLEAFLNGK